MREMKARPATLEQRRFQWPLFQSENMMSIEFLYFHPILTILQCVTVHSADEASFAKESGHGTEQLTKPECH